MKKYTGAKDDIQGKKKKKHKGLIIFLIIVIILVCIGIWFARKIYILKGNWMAAIMGHNEETIKELDPIKILLLGESTGMSDTIIVCSYNPKTQQASMLSIPRDTYVGEGYSVKNKINSLYSDGETPEETLKAVNEITGLDIQNYILVDTEALIKLVDLIGEVEFEVPIDMKYDDYDQDLHINLSKGNQKLTGKQVEQVVRFRHNNDGSTYSYEYGMEDYGRMRTQRDVIVAVAKQTFKLKNITEIKNIIDIIEEYVNTNISFSDIKDYIPYVMNLDLSTVKTAQLPGESDNNNRARYMVFLS